MIGVAVSTCRRPQVQTLPAALDAWERHGGPDGTVMTITDADLLHGDGTRAGTAETKNAGIAALMAAGCDHLFLVDDDVWPTTPDWWRGYLDADEPHLSLCWGNARRLGKKGPYTVWRWPRGVVLYAERRVIEAVGGMRTEFDTAGGGEHVEWSRRIHNAGLTRWPFADLTAARHWWHAEDWGRPGETTLGARRAANTTVDRSHHEQQRWALYDRFRGTRDFVPY